MKIAIIEVMPAGHFTLVDSIIRIFTADMNNHVTLYTHALGKDIMRELQKEKGVSLEIITPQENESIESFISHISTKSFDRIYITTMYKYFKIFSSAHFHSSIYLVIHDIDEWFQATFLYRLAHLVHDFSFTRAYVYTFKQRVVFPYWKKRIGHKVIAHGGKIVVLSSAIKKLLATIIDESHIEVVPFSIYNEALRDTSTDNSKLRLCIPGVISALRRDYYSVFNVIESDISFFKDTIELDILGKMTNEESGYRIVQRAEELIQKGVTIHLYKDGYIPNIIFDEQLTKADLVLGTTFVVRDKFSTYGKTKETGIPFAMIHAAKPGLLIKGMIVPEELQTSTIFFNNYSELLHLLRDLIINKRKLAMLKEEAKKNSLHFSPSVVYYSLTK